MPELDIQAQVEYREKGNSSVKNVIIFAVAPGDSMTDWRTEKVLSVKDLDRLFDDVNKAKKITLLTRGDAAATFVANRAIDRISMDFKQQKSGTTGGTLRLEKCQDLKVIKSFPLSKEVLLAAEKAVKHKISGVEAGKAQVVTLQLSDTKCGPL